MNLNGQWKLYYFVDSSIKIDDVSMLESKKVPNIACTVPGNVELDLSAAGLLPIDLFKGKNIKEAEKYEVYEWWYEKKFVPDAPANGQTVTLHFGGVDCIADYYINGVKIGSSDNMLIAHDFDVTDILKYGEENSLHINIHSPIAAAQNEPCDPDVLLYSWHQTNVSKVIRKAPHSYGWDIMPRAVSAGIWRDVELKYESVYRLKYYYFNVIRLKDDGSANVCFVFDSFVGADNAFTQHKVILRGNCGNSKFEHVAYCDCNSGRVFFDIKDIKLWWPKNYGKPNMYDIAIEIYGHDDRLLISKMIRQGFRTLKLNRSETANGRDGCFDFVINGKRIMAVGSNWVPMDAYHSRDKQRYAKALELANDIGCNILRCWGGNVYEDDEFFEFCDDNGIMVWQDFAMACHMYPQDNAFSKKIEEEVKYIVERLRNHACLVVWCGDNEIDYMLAVNGVKPSINRITRQTIPSILSRLDPLRPYIPSSPYISDEAFELGSKAYPEDHLWGPRDYFKSDFYTGSNAYFISETGYHGCPAKKSIEKFIDKEYVWPYTDNEQWNLHSSDQHNRPERTMLMHKQIQQLFGEVPQDIDNYAQASQISQAEAKKFFIERVRANMSVMGGVIWWNLIDGWPQMSDAVVDYYYEKKLAYNYIKRSSYPTIVLMGEMQSWGQPVIVANSTLKEVKGHIEIADAETGKTVYETDYTASPNSNKVLDKLPIMYSDKGMYIIKYTVNGKKHLNTYLYGTPAFDYNKYCKWMKAADMSEKEF